MYTDSNLQLCNFPPRMLYANSSSVDNSTYSSVGGDGGWTMKMTPVTAILATLGGAGQTSAQKGARQGCHIGSSLLQFPPKESRTEEGRVRKAALVLFKEKGGKLVLARVRDFNSPFTHKFHSSTLYVYFISPGSNVPRPLRCVLGAGLGGLLRGAGLPGERGLHVQGKANSTI